MSYDVKQKLERYSVLRAEEYMARMQNNSAKALKQKTKADKILNAIFCLNDPVQRHVMYYRYILRIDWIHIAYYTGYSIRGCKYIRDKACKEIKI